MEIKKYTFGSISVYLICWINVFGDFITEKNEPISYTLKLFKYQMLLTDSIWISAEIKSNDQRIESHY